MAKNTEAKKAKKLENAQKYNQKQREESGKATTIEQALNELKLTQKKEGSIDALIPLNPGPGLLGETVSLHANYFEFIKQRTKVTRYYLYSITAFHDNKEYKGPRLRQLVKILLNDEAVFSENLKCLATDFRQILVSIKDLTIGEDDGDFQIKYRKPFNGDEQGNDHANSQGDEGPEDEGSGKQKGSDQANGKFYRIQVRPLEHDNVINLQKASQQLLRYGMSLTDVAFHGQFNLIQLMNIISTHRLKERRKVSIVGGNRFFPWEFDEPEAGSENSNAQTTKLRIGGGIEARRGVFSSVRIADNRFLLNVNVTTSVFHVQEALNISIEEYLRGHQPRNSQSDAVQKFVKGLRVHQNGADGIIERHVFGLGTPNKDEDGGWMINIGNASFPDSVPASSLTVFPGNHYKFAPKYDQTAKLIRFAVKDPASTFNQTSNTLLDELGINEDGNCISLPVQPRLIELPGRRLVRPIVQYGDANTRVEPDINGKWDMRSLQVTPPTGKKTFKWSWVRFTPHHNPLDDLPFDTTIHHFVEDLSKKGIILDLMETPSTRVVLMDEQDPVIQQTLGGYQNKNLDFLLVVLPHFRGRMAALYENIKSCTDCEFGYQTVCVLPSKFTIRRDSYNVTHVLKSKHQTFNWNVALKINLKCGGVNQYIPPSELGIHLDKTLLCGYDVTHPNAPSKKSYKRNQSKKSASKVGEAGPSSAEEPAEPEDEPYGNSKVSDVGLIVEASDNRQPSIAAMVANVSGNLAHWPAVIRLQEDSGVHKAGQEMVIKLQEMFESRLECWRDIGGHSLYPEQLIFYRDGVSESQYETVMKQEMRLINQACYNKYTAIKQELPKITFVVVGKRHHTRFMGRDDRGIVSNPQYGTVVDNGLSHLRIWDFYLQAHTPIQGTARPTHYVVLKDDIFRSKTGAGEDPGANDRLQNLTNRLCYLNGRALLPVSIPPPAKFADLACSRARAWVARYLRNTDASLGPPTSADIQVHRALRDTMFYI